MTNSYHVYRMISLARAEKVHPITSSEGFDPLYFVATSTTTSSGSTSNASAPILTFYLQVANTQQTPVPLTGTIHNVTIPTRTGTANPVSASESSTKRTRSTGKRKPPTFEAEATILAALPGQPYDVGNDLDNPTEVVPYVQSIKDASLNTISDTIEFNLTIPGWSFGVYRFSI